MDTEKRFARSEYVLKTVARERFHAHLRSHGINKFYIPKIEQVFADTDGIYVHFKIPLLWGKHVSPFTYTKEEREEAFSL